MGLHLGPLHQIFQVQHGVFLFQGLLIWIVTLPVQAGQVPDSPDLGWMAAAGTAVWITGFLFEGIADLQLARFKADPTNEGRVLQTGVWRYTRHPNYFGDTTQWWAFYLVAAAGGGFWTIYSPILMTALLLRVSGVALLEKSLKEAKPKYKEYVETTSAFIPWFPRKRG